jgi:hypothetical protein
MADSSEKKQKEKGTNPTPKKGDSKPPVKAKAEVTGKQKEEGKTLPALEIKSEPNAPETSKVKERVFFWWIFLTFMELGAETLCI